MVRPPLCRSGACILFWLVTGGLGAVCSAAVPQSEAPGVGSSASTPPAAETPTPDPRALLDEYCVVCDNARTRTAGQMLDRADVHEVAAGAETWEKVVRKVRSGAMPPPGRRAPTRRSSTPSSRGSRPSSTRPPPPGRTRGAPPTTG